MRRMHEIFLGVKVQEMSIRLLCFQRTEGTKNENQNGKRIFAVKKSITIFMVR